MQAMETTKKKIRLRLIALSIAIAMTPLLFLLLGSTLVRDVVRYQNEQYTTTVCDMMKTQTEQTRSEAKELLDQMSLDMHLGKLMNYTECETVDLLAGLRQLKEYRKACPWVDSIYLYNSLNHSFYIVSDYALQAVQAKEEMFDSGIVDIVDRIHSYKNMEPIVRCVPVTWPSTQNLNYITFVRYNTLAKNDTNIYFININQDSFFALADAWEETDDTCLMYLSKDGEILMTHSQISETTSLAGLINQTAGEKGVIYPSTDVMAVYDRNFPFDWTFVYQMTVYDQFSAMSSVEYGLTKLLVLVALLVLLLLLMVVFVRRFLHVMHERNIEIQTIEQEKQRVRDMEKHYHLLDALHGKKTIDGVSGTIARLIVVTGFAETIEKVANQLFGVLKEDTVVFAEEDDRHRFVYCLKSSETEEFRIMTNTHIADAGFVIVSDEFEYPSGLSESYEQCIQMEAYEPLCIQKRIFTRDDLINRQNYNWDSASKVAYLQTTLQELDQQASCELVRDIVDHLTSGTLQDYHDGILKLLVAVSETLSQIERQYGVQTADNEAGSLKDLSPKQVEAHLCGLIGQTMEDIQDKRTSRFEVLTSDICAFIRENAAKGDFCANTVAEHFELSAPYLSRIFKKQSGKSVSEYIVEVRLELATKLLTETSLPIAIVAEKSGFTDAQYFHRVFKNNMNRTPGSFRKNASGKGEGNNGTDNE